MVFEISTFKANLNLNFVGVDASYSIELTNNTQLSKEITLSVYWPTILIHQYHSYFPQISSNHLA